MRPPQALRPLAFFASCLALFPIVLARVEHSQSPILALDDDNDPAIKPPGHRRPVPEAYYRRYSEQTFIGAHNSAAVRTAQNNWSLSGNQYFNLTVQLDAGVRLIQAQGHRDPNGTEQIRLCHFNCALMDGGSLEEYLETTKTWLEENPREVVTFLFVNSGVPLMRWAQAFVATGFDAISYTPPPEKRYGRMGVEDWPTIEEMVSSGKRAVTFLSRGAWENAVPWILPEFSYVFESDFGNEVSTDFTCHAARPRSPNIPDRLSLINHFLYSKFLGIRFPNVNEVNHTNGAGMTIGELGEHAHRCRELYQRRPNFLLVDFFNEGDVFDVEHDLNAS